MSPPRAGGPPGGGTPALLITIDTEGDNLWARPKNVTTRNALFLPRFQALCERHGCKPVYLTNYEMVRCLEFVEFARDAIRRGRAEVGMHLHAWNSPPAYALTPDDGFHQPFLPEYPDHVLEAKVRFLTELLADTFDAPVVSHRAGRWSFDHRYARALIANGYLADCSVTPRVSWCETLGDPAGGGGADYSRFPDTPYFIDPEDIGRPGASPLLEVPMTILSLEPGPVRAIREQLPHSSLPARALRRFLPPVAWLRPDGTNRSAMLRILDRARREAYPCAEFMLHSSELMPGGSPSFPTERSIELLYEDLEAIFSAAARSFIGATLAEFRRRWPDAPDRGSGD